MALLGLFRRVPRRVLSTNTLATFYGTCDNDQVAVNAIKVNSDPKYIYDDIKTRDNATTPAVDIYVAGFPCQPFSQAGLGQGFGDAKGRGKIFFNVLD